MLQERINRLPLLATQATLSHHIAAPVLQQTVYCYCCCMQVMWRITCKKTDTTNGKLLTWVVPLHGHSHVQQVDVAGRVAAVHVISVWHAEVVGLDVPVDQPALVQALQGLATVQGRVAGNR